MEDILLKVLVSNTPVTAIVAVGGVIWLNTKFKNIENQLDELKGGKMWSETCAAQHKEVDHRLDKIERVLNGSFKKD